MSGPRLILASASPRRRELLALLGVPFEVDATSEVDEEAARGTAREVVLALAVRKAEAARRGAAASSALERGAPIAVLAGDTVVALGEGRERERFGKPRGVAGAREMIRRLAGRTHGVWTGVALAVGGDPVRAEAEVTQVAFRRLTPAETERYLATGDHEGKAGAYGIQGAGAALVESIAGCYYNVVGLPLALTARLLAEAGLRPRPSCDCAEHPLQRGSRGCGLAFPPRPGPGDG